MRVLIASVAVAAVLGSAAATSGTAQASRCHGARTSPAHVKRFLRAVLCLHNAERRKRGMSSLRPRRALRRAARSHARDMVGRRYFEHVSPSGSDPVSRALASGYRGSRRTVVGENLLTWSGALTPAQVMRAWMASPPHRSDILRGSWKEVGIALVRSCTSGGPGLTVVVEFGRRYG